MDQRPELRERQARVLDAAAERGLAGVVALGRAFYDRPGPCAWLSGHHPPFLAAASHPGLQGAGFGILVLAPDAPATLVCDPTGAREDLVAADAIHASDDVWHALAETLRGSGLADARVGLAGGDLLPATAATVLADELPALALEPLDELLDELRAIKSPLELALLDRAGACADAALAATVGRLRAGASEREAAASGTEAALRAGADHVRYLRVHSGPWSERTARWPPALDRTPQDGELVMVDVIGACEGYAFDVARTILLGSGTGPRRALLEACAAAADAGAAACVAGACVADVLEAAAAVYGEAGLADAMRPFAGHGIGIETVEPPLLSPATRELVLREGMALCVEPGVVVPGVGGALIEHELVVCTATSRLICATSSLS